MNSVDYRGLARDAGSFVKKAGTLLAQQQASAKIRGYKDIADIVTTADLASETLLVSLIHKKYPSHSIDSEEMGVKKQDSPYVWIIDPLDGTKEYARGITEYNCLIAVAQNDELVAGAMWREGTHDLHICAKGHGSTLNGKPIMVSATSNLKKSFIGFHIPVGSLPDALIDSSMALMRDLIGRAYRVRPGWDDARLLGWVAQGVLDAHVVIPGTNKWCDIAPAVLLVTEAGGTVSTMKGNPLTPERYKTEGLLASNASLQDQLLKLTLNAV